MIHKVTETITFIKTPSKKKLSIDRIKTYLLRTGGEKSELSTENQDNLSQDMCDKYIIELADGTYKIKQTQDRKLVEETQSKITCQGALIPETQKFPDCTTSLLNYHLVNHLPLRD